jgi:hypothetical protein
MHCILDLIRQRARAFALLILFVSVGVAMGVDDRARRAPAGPAPQVAPARVQAGERAGLQAITSGTNEPGRIQISQRTQETPRIESARPEFCGAAERHPGTNDRVCIARGNGIAVKVMRKPGVWTTRDGTNWLYQPTGMPNRLYDVAFGNGIFVAVGNEGALVSSPDGVAWSVRNARTDERLRGIEFGKGRFVAVGYAGTVLTSQDGVRWKPRKSRTTERLLGVAFDSRNFITVGCHGVVLTSADGSRWIQRPSAITNHFDETVLRRLALAHPTALPSTNATRRP